MKTYQKLADLVRISQAIMKRHADDATQSAVADRLTDEAEVLVKRTAPSGSGIDCGTKLNLDKSNGNRLVFDLSFHHMNDGGYYDGWTEHSVVIKAHLAWGYEIRVTGRDRNSIKEYLLDTYSFWLNSEVTK